MDWAGAGGGTVPLATMTNDTFRITYDLVPDITSFNANLVGSSTSIQSLSATAGTVVVTVPLGTTAAQIAALAPTYTLDLGTTCNQPNNSIPSPALSLTTPVHYIVTAQDGTTTKDFSVTVVRSPFTFAAWTGDADSGLVSTSQYTVAVNLGGSAVTVNGVDFQDDAVSGANFSIEGDVYGWGPGDGQNITGNSLALANTFIYGGDPRTVTLKNLTTGKAYETTFFSYGFDVAGRTETFASGGDSRVIDQDAYGAGNGIRILYRFVAASTNQVITITPAEGSIGTFHLCALANRVVPPDTNAPTPNPMAFAVLPAGHSVTSIVMTATTAVDAASSPVSYFFENTNTSVNSGWVPGLLWTNTGLTPGLTYGFRVMARDAVSNATAWSAVATAKPLDLVLYVVPAGCTNLSFMWSGTGFKLQMRTNLMVGDWFDYPGGGQCPMIVPLTNPCAFFRVVQ